MPADPQHYVSSPGPPLRSDILVIPGRSPARLQLVHATWGLCTRGRYPRQAHAHDVYHLVLVHAGAGSVLVGDESLPVEAPIVLLCPPGQPHIFTGLPGETIIYSEATFVGQAGTLPLRLDWGELLTAWSGHPVTVPTRIVPDEVSATRIEESIRELVTDGLSAPPALAALIQGNLARLLMLVLRLASAAPSPEADRLEATRRFIATSATEAPTLAECARLAGMAPKPFLRAFKARFGLPPSQYRRRILCRQAESLLRGTGLSLPEIAQRCGFRDPHYFNRWFTREHGQPPGRWRHYVNRTDLAAPPA